MSLLFDDFRSWKEYCSEKQIPLYSPVLEYEKEQKGRIESQVWKGLGDAYQVMNEAVQTGLTEDTQSRSGMINNGGKKVADNSTSVLGPEFQQLIARTLAAKEVNSCMGKVVAAPTAGASGILPGVLVTLQKLHDVPEKKILEALLIGERESP
jgi:L-serine dehydratase